MQCRVRVLAGFANAVILLFVALNIVLEASVHIMGGGHDVTTHRLLPVSVIGLLVNIVGLLFVHEAHAHHNHAHGMAQAVKQFEQSMYLHDAGVLLSVHSGPLSA